MPVAIQSAVTFQTERWTDFRADAEALFPLHWAEVAIDKEYFPPDMDHERYGKLDEMGMLLVVTARHEARLVGYAIWFVMTHAHYKSSGLTALTDMYFVLPEYRIGGCGAKLFSESDKELRRLGVVRAHTSCKVHQDHEPLLVALGWRFTDKTFSKMLRH